MGKKHRPVGSPIADPTGLWNKAKQRLEKMTPEEFGDILVDAGILTKKGNVTKPYRGVLVKVTPQMEQ
jgi:hypothetical protein